MGLPSFIIVGERRCGTSYLAALIERHPDIFLHPKRELGFFIDDGARWAARRRIADARGERNGARGDPDAAVARWEAGHPIDAYRAQFDGARDRPLVGEKSADYLFWRPTHARLARHLPDARLIVILRDPVARAWSHYWNEVGKRRERLPFAEAVAAEGARAGASLYGRNHASYLRRGCYDESLEHLFRHVPRRSVLVVMLDDLIRAREQTLAEVCAFVGASALAPEVGAAAARNANWTMVPKPWLRRFGLQGLAEAYGRACELVPGAFLRSRSERRAATCRLKAPLFRPASEIAMPEAVRAELAERYRPHMRRLARLLGREVPQWCL